jgi:salicylate hydroxylase
MPQVEEEFGAPLLVVHRADLQKALLKAARRADIDVQTGHHVDVVDFGSGGIIDVYPVRRPRYKVNEGDWLEADVIICADGIKSHIRREMLKIHGQIEDGMSPLLSTERSSSSNSSGDSAQNTGDAAYRITIPREKLLSRPELLKFVDESISYRWMGPGGHIMVYPIRNHQLFNMVLLHPDRCDTEESWTATGPKSKMIEFYSSWSPTVRALLDLVEEDEIPEWQLKIHRPLISWVEGNVALMGDACHPTLPYVAQGAAQAAEDAGVLAAVLSLISNKADIHTALLIYSVCHSGSTPLTVLIIHLRNCVNLAVRP